jgi:hypothetical protein
MAQTWLVDQRKLQMAKRADVFFRPFLPLLRLLYPPHPASHRYPVQWTGDTGSTWEFLHRCVENGVRSGVERLHAYVNDYSGFGEYCCWTTALVKVNVTP